MIFLDIYNAAWQAILVAFSLQILNEAVRDRDPNAGFGVMLLMLQLGAFAISISKLW